MLSTLAQYSTEIAVVCALLVVLLAAFVWRLSRKLKAITERFEYLMQTTSGNNLESVLREHFTERSDHKRTLTQLEDRVTTVERRLAKSKRHLGLVRYDAFQDIGGQQSFSLSLYDDNGDGAVITSIISREGARVFGKPILGGKSDISLTNEENQAIMSASGSGTNG